MDKLYVWNIFFTDTDQRNEFMHELSRQTLVLYVREPSKALYYLGCTVQSRPDVISAILPLCYVEHVPV